MNVEYNDLATACVLCGECAVASPQLRHYPGVDPCLGLLPDVVQACCGHGVGNPYVVVAPGNAPGTMIPYLSGAHSVISGDAALEYFAAIGVGPPAACSDVADGATLAAV